MVPGLVVGYLSRWDCLTRRGLLRLGAREPRRLLAPKRAVLPVGVPAAPAPRASGNERQRLPGCSAVA